MDNYKTLGTHWDTDCLTVILWKPSFFRIDTTLPLNGVHHLKQGRRKQFYIGQAEFLNTLECMEKCSYPHRHIGYLYCAKHNQHARNSNARGSGSMPPRKFLKNRYSEIEFGGISGPNNSYKSFSLKINIHLA